MSYASPTPQPARHHTAELFSRTGIAASAQNAAQTRAEFGQWLTQYLPVDETRLCDLLLATYEALANAAEYAYLQSPGRRGTMDLRAVYDRGRDQFVVTVDDHGVWRTPAALTGVAARFRGRGLPLMRELADEATVSCSEVGTHVRLLWNHLRTAP